ncbi:MAG: ATP-binding cassette domain-containing protein [Hyphomonadaceae bacterium]|nr:ATP-binding cassette domain-containing protein [Hyphomonadaceae bacterium]
MTEPALVLNGATKRFGAFTAVDQLSFQVPAGSIIGFLGPNGAGKSTSLRMALGIMTPDEGSVSLFGAHPDLSALRRVGFLPEERGLYKKMTARQTVAYFARLKGLSARDANRRADELLESTGLGEFARAKISKLSKGMAQKVQILSTLAHTPDFLILDEPFSGLDPVNQQALEEIIREQHAAGATILFSTHVMEHAERLCQSIVMMARGRKVFDGTLDAAFDALGRRAKIAVEAGYDLPTALATTGFHVERDSHEHEDGADWWLVSLPDGRSAQNALRAAIDAGAPIAGFMQEEARLRDVFVELVEREEARGKLAPQPELETL